MCQDLYIDKLTQQILKLEEQISITEMQCKAQAKETKAMRETLVEATMEFEVTCISSCFDIWLSCVTGIATRTKKINATME